ncbi:hypothetical protein E5288_WYG008467 [Bos mutus]|uniref:Uncharacterized protein n=1 Tax=Bos mutus TaxID=72004 RepID=A0A6B0RXQ2_9CETA|nr:hypothetical protein [Bos mutus]
MENRKGKSCRRPGEGGVDVLEMSSWPPCPPSDPVSPPATSPVDRPTPPAKERGREPHESIWSVRSGTSSYIHYGDQHSCPIKSRETTCQGHTQGHPRSQGQVVLAGKSLAEPYSHTPRSAAPSTQGHDEDADVLGAPPPGAPPPDLPMLQPLGAHTPRSPRRLSRLLLKNQTLGLPAMELPHLRGPRPDPPKHTTP